MSREARLGWGAASPREKDESGERQGNAATLPVPVARYSGGGISGVEGVKEQMQGPRFFFFANEGEKRERSGEY